MQPSTTKSSISTLLGLVGCLALLGFVVMFVNIPWEWSMFMDDTLYNGWMPKITNLNEVIRNEIATYWRLGRFYPVKYIANLLKWKYLPNDPSVFRYFNFLVFLCSVSMCALGVLKVALPKRDSNKWPLFFFLVGSSLLHKPLLETISLNPLGETWVCFFFSFGVFFLFTEHWFSRFFLARLCFVLVALSKEPAALVLFASSLRYFLLAWGTRNQRKKLLAQAGIDLAIFFFFFSLVLYVMSQGSFTKGAYFATTPWLQYLWDFIYKNVRYILWTSPFIALFALCYKDLKKMSADIPLLAAVVFFLCFGFSYMVFMSTQGIVAYQEIPESIAFFCLFSLLSVWLFKQGALERSFKRYGLLLLALFCLSYFISVSRWQRYVRGIIEPRRAVESLLASGNALTLLIPVGEIEGHIQEMIKEKNPRARVFQIDENLAQVSAKFTGQVYVFEFPYYMGNLASDTLQKTEALLGGWENIQDARTYRLYRAHKIFPY